MLSPTEDTNLSTQVLPKCTESSSSSSSSALNPSLGLSQDSSIS